MNAFMINTSFGKSQIDATSKVNEKFDGRFLIRDDKESFRVASGDGFCSITEMDPYGTNVDNIILQYKGTANKVHTVEDKNLSEQELIENGELVKAGKKPIRYFKHQIDFKNARTFERHNKLDDYSYSLVRVYKRFNVPARHFSRTITSLNQNDFETFKKERIYYLRTLFGRLINALPYENRLQFVISCIEKYNTPKFHLKDLEEGLEFLKEFVNGGILQLGRIIVESDQIAASLKFLGNDVGFIDPEQLPKHNTKRNGERYLRHVDYLDAQAVLFNDLLTDSIEFKKLFSLEGFQVNTSETRHFKKLFRASNWPIDLTQDRYE